MFKNIIIAVLLASVICLAVENDGLRADLQVKQINAAIAELETAFMEADL